MREILFRGKRTDNGEWVEGLLWKKKHNSNKIFISYFPDEDDYEDAVVVDPETVGQYTGLKDKNGKKIFEGDVIRAYGEIGGYDFTAEVEWGNFIKGWYCGKYRPMYDGFNNEYEVIGNKWDNPELLEGDK